MSESLRPEPNPTLSHLSAIERAVFRRRYRQFKGLLGKLPSGEAESELARVQVARNGFGGMKVEIKMENDKTHQEVTIIGSYNDMTGEFEGLQAVDEGYLKNGVPAWRAEYSTFARPEANQMKSGEIVSFLRIAKQTMANQA